MKKEKGMTLVSLVMTIILMLILASVATYSGIESYKSMKVQAFVAKMATVQEAVDKLCTKYEDYTEDTIVSAIATDMAGDYVGYDTAPSTATTVLDDVIGGVHTTNSWDSTYDEATANYIYFSIENISTYLGVKNFDVAIWVNPITRNVIAVEGVTSTDDDTEYYRQYDLSGGQTLY